MSLTRFTAAMLWGIGLAMVLAGALSAAERPAASGNDAAEPPELGGPRPPHPFSGHGPGPWGAGRLRLQPEPGRDGPPRGGIPGRPGPPGLPGPLVQGGPRRPPHPSGPPRWPHHDWNAFEKNDPEMYKLLKDDYDLERQTRELAIQYRRAPGAQRTDIKQRLSELVNKHFEVRQERRLLELKRLEEELKRLRDAIDLRNEAREELVKERILQLLGEEGDLEF